jgi:hypothetical protein
MDVNSITNNVHENCYREAYTPRIPKGEVDIITIMRHSPIRINWNQSHG